MMMITHIHAFLFKEAKSNGLHDNHDLMQIFCPAPLPISFIAQSNIRYKWDNILSTSYTYKQKLRSKDSNDNIIDGENSPTI